MENFGCCSHYVECSNDGSCLFPADENYKGCSYNKNLLNGNIFYGERKAEDSMAVIKNVTEIVNSGNERIEKETIIDKSIVKKPEKIYIDCYDRNFNVGRLGGNGYTYALTESEMGIVIAAFEKVPFCHEVEKSKCIMEGDAREPANARVIFTVDGCAQKFVIGNYNSCFILKRYADGITKALMVKGISAITDMFGAYVSKTDNQKVNISSIVNIDKVDKTYKREFRADSIDKIKNVVNNQISMFELAGNL